MIRILIKYLICESKASYIKYNKISNARWRSIRVSSLRSQNVLLSGNPDFTYFYKTYKKYAHFAEESVTQSMDGPQDLSYDQPIQVRLKFNVWQI